MKLSTWAKNNGIGYKTAYNWFKTGKLPVSAYQTPTGTILITPSVEKEKQLKKVALYGRVSSNDQKTDLDRQMNRLRDYASANGYAIDKEVKEIASGMNSKRPALNGLLNNPEITTIIVEHKDRLTRFGFELLNSTMMANSREIIVINQTEQNMDLIQDFVDVITSMCARIYGQRSAKNKADKALKAIQE